MTGTRIRRDSFLRRDGVNQKGVIYKCVFNFSDLLDAVHMINSTGTT